MMTARAPASAGQDGGGGGGSAEMSNGTTGKKQRDRWTDAEHKLFLEALKQFGRDWRNIELHVGSKTAVQIRSHAQKFFAKVERAPHIVDFQLPPPRPKRRPGQSAADQNKSGTTRSESGTGPYQRSATDARRTADDATKSGNVQGSAPPRPHLPPGFAQWTNGVDLSWMDAAPGSLNELMHNIAVAALTSAAVTAHAVVAAAGQEYIQRVQKLCEENERYRFLQLPLSSSRSTLSQPSPQSTAPNPGTTATNPSGGTSTDFNTTSLMPKSATPEPSIQPSASAPPPPTFKSMPGIIGTLMNPEKFREQLGLNPDGTPRVPPTQEQSTQALHMLDTLLHSLPSANPPPPRRAHPAPQPKRPRSSNSNREDSAGTTPGTKRRKTPSEAPKRPAAPIPRAPSACLPITTAASRSNLESQDAAARVKATLHAQRPTMSAPCGRTGAPSWGEPPLGDAAMAGATSDSGPTDEPPNNDSRGSDKAGTDAAGDGSDGDRCEHVGSGGGSAQPSGGSGSGGSGSKSAKESGNIDQAKAAHVGPPFEAKPNNVAFLPYPFMHKQQQEGQQDWAKGCNQEQAVQAAALVQQYKQAYEYGQAGLAWAQQAGWINGNVQVDPSHSAAPAACDAANPVPEAQVASANPQGLAAEGPYPALPEHKRTNNTMHSRAGYSNRHGHVKSLQPNEGAKEATLAAEAAHQKEDYNAQKRHGSLPHRDEPMDQQDTASSIQDTHSMRAERSCMPAQCVTSVHEEEEDANAEGAANKDEEEDEDEINSVMDGSDEGSNEPVCGASNDDCNARDPRLQGRGRAGSAKDSNSVRPQKKKQRCASAPAVALEDPEKREVTPGLASDGSCGSGNSEEQPPAGESKHASTGVAARPAHRPNDGSGNASFKGSGGQPSSPEEQQGGAAAGSNCDAVAGMNADGNAGGQQQAAERAGDVPSANAEATPSPPPSPGAATPLGTELTPFGPELPPKTPPSVELEVAKPASGVHEQAAAGATPEQAKDDVTAAKSEQA